ncbi:MAG: hypothetical protein KDD22_03575 [Bdellovibrionales bacterium]|nr:hypothetical protein [Bdellovibrionales bacterium]
MKYIKPCILKAEKDLVEYAQKTHEQIGVDFPVEYFNQGFIRGCRDLEENLVGGYALITDGPLRTLESLPDDFKNPYDPEDLCEITALWLNRDSRHGLPSCQFWYQFCRDISHISSKSHFIYSYSLKNEKLRNIYSLVKPEVLYQGQVKKLVGNKETGVESVEVARKNSFVYFPFYSFHRFAHRLAFGRKPFYKELAQKRFRRSEAMEPLR